MLAYCFVFWRNYSYFYLVIPPSAIDFDCPVFLCMIYLKIYCFIIGLNGFFQEFMHVYTVPMHSQTLHKRLNRLILIILQCNTEHKNIFLHYDIPGLKIKQIKIPRNVVDDVGTLGKKKICVFTVTRPTL